MKLETIERDGQALVVVPMAQYEQLLEDVEMLADIRQFRQAKLADEECFPGEVIDRIIHRGPPPYQGLSVVQGYDAAAARGYRRHPAILFN